MVLPKRMTFGTPFEISTGESVVADELVLTAIHIPARHEEDIKFPRPSGEFSLLNIGINEESTFTMHGDRNFFSRHNVLVHLIKAKGPVARCILLASPPVTHERAAEIALANAKEHGDFDAVTGSYRVHVGKVLFSRILLSELRVIWQVLVESPSREGNWKYSKRVTVDAVTGEVL